MDPQLDQNPITSPPDPVATPPALQPVSAMPQTGVSPEAQIMPPESQPTQPTAVNQGTMVNQGNIQIQPDLPKHGLMFRLGISLGIFIVLTALCLLPVLHGVTNYSFNGLGEAGSTQDSSANPGCVATSSSVDTAVKGFPLAYGFTRTMSNTTNCNHTKPCGGSFQVLCSYQQSSSKVQVMAYSNVGLGIDIAVAFVLTLIISLVLFIVMKTRKPSQAEVPPPSGAMANVGFPQDVAQDEPNNS